jgi:hypothetical protein
VQRDESVFQLQALKQLSRHGNLVGLLVDDCAAQVMLAGYCDRAQNRGAAAVLGLLAIQYDQLIFGYRTAYLCRKQLIQPNLLSPDPRVNICLAMEFAFPQ